ncbi:MAG: DUF1328 domain-containing protein [Methanotrichaceae archaeon]
MADLLTLAIIFFVLAIIAAVLGMWGVAGVSMEVAKWLVIIFVVLAIISILLGGSPRILTMLPLVGIGG